jgi:hypothetical protein
VCRESSHKVEDSELRRSRRVLGLPPVILEPPPPPLRQKLDHQGSFEANGAFEPEQPPEESTANLGVIETSNVDFGPDIIVPIQFYESLSAPNPVMEQITSSGTSSIPITVVTTGEASPNLPLSAVRTTTVSAATTSHSGLLKCKTLTLVKAKVSTKTLASNKTFPGNLVPVKPQDPFIPAISSSLNYLSWQRYTCRI